MRLLNYSVIAFALIVFPTCSQAQNMENDSIDKKYTIQNCVNHFNVESVVKTKVGYQYWFADKDFLDGRTLKLSVVNPHEATHAPHKHPEDEFFFVLEGTAEFYLDGQTVVSGPYTSFYCPSNVEHGIKNVGDTELKYLVIKKYEKK
jgi:quercetin dioxygenase-like cupin family protein